MNCIFRSFNVEIYRNSAMESPFYAKTRNQMGIMDTSVNSSATIVSQKS